MYKVIVVGTDGSGRAGVAVREALALAKAAGATLHVVHVVRTAPTTTLGTEYTDVSVLAAANAELHDQGNQICAQVVSDAEREGVSTQVHNVEGDPGEVLNKVAQGVGADLNVIGKRGMTGMKRFVLGSVPNKVSHHCPCSLLIVNTDSD